MVTIEDEKRQKPSPHPLFRDSLYFNVFDYERKLGISTSIGLRPNMGVAEAAFVVFQNDKILISYAETGLKLPDSDWDDICVGRVCYKWVKPLQSFDIKYRDDKNDVYVELYWDGFTPIFDYKNNVHQLPSIVYSLHYEQAGRVRGGIESPEGGIKINGCGIRDHSAGVRDWNSIDRWYFVSGIRDKGFVFCLWTVYAGEEEGTGGWVYRDGKLVGVQDASYDLRYADERKSKHLGGLITFRDDEGQSFSLESEVITKIFPFDFGKSVLNEAYAKYLMGDKTLYGLFELLWRK
ncbi:MAG: DUF7064 domain-containing protein [Candidatus Njordarchaeia archaeon]